MFYLVPVFVILPLILMAVMIIVPNHIGKKLSPSFTKTKYSVLQIKRNDLFDLLVNYENYPIWLKYLSFVNVEKKENNKLKIIQTYSDRKTSQELTEVRRINTDDRTEVSIVKLENEFTVLWTYILEDEGEDKTKITIKETSYVYHPYFRFIFKYILTDENGKNEFLIKLKKYVNKK
ncbi:SRPBCC family protein [Brachyspira sp. SAP_772]|uniref:SRPBCC family protein n=1 Tax=Brachyspira sp. SAP_772 TaxID=2608385 RepID=UPI0012F5210D|nr:SRPBCC family protein [Brachyspira sp. SAP_772]